MLKPRRLRLMVSASVIAAVSVATLQAVTPEVAAADQPWPSWFTPAPTRPVSAVPVTAEPPAHAVAVASHPPEIVRAPRLPVGAHTMTLPRQSARVGASGAQRTNASAGGTAATVTGAWQPVSGSSFALAQASRAGGDTGTSTNASQVSVTTLTEAQAAKYGNSGLAFALNRPPGSAETPLAVRVPRSALRAQFGADFAERSRWTQTPADGSAPARPVASSEDPAHDTILLTPTVGGTPTVVTASSGPSSGSGNFTASPLNPASSWNVSAQTGDFSWSYPMAAPPPAAGPTPQIALQYDSQSVDGETGSTNNQPSVVGDGWSLAGSGFIERSYVPCAKDVTNAHADSGDLCWSSDNATMNFAGHSGSLVRNPGTTKWHLRDDDGSTVEHLTGTNNGDQGTAGVDGTGEYWKLTTTDGTQYFFGVNEVPGYQSGDDSTNSAWTVPVFGNDPTDPCHASNFSTSHCVQAWRWNLAYVVDPNGNAEKFTYSTEVNNYAMYNVTSPAASYIRGGTLDRIDYGLRASDLHLHSGGSDRVVFANVSRCAPGYDCATAVKDHNSWPDVPWDQNCATTAPTTTCAASLNSPTFWTTRRLGSVTTQYRLALPTAQNKDPYSPVDNWTLTHGFPPPGDGTDAALWLSSVKHTAGGATTPAYTTLFDTNSGTMQNRVNPNTDLGAMPLDKWRITTVVNEMGGATDITYSAQECTAADVPSITSSPQSNTKRCYPAWWTPRLGAPQEDLFHKYVVTRVVSRPVTAGADNPASQTQYVYGAPAWRYDDSPATLAAYRTWSVYAGYDTVEERDGAGQISPQTSVKTVYYRGMDGDHGAPIGSVKLHLSDSSTPTDSRWLAGQPAETVVSNGVGGAVLTDAIATPWVSHVTADDGTWQARVVLAGTTSTTSYTAGGSRLTLTRNVYDDHGRLIQTDDVTPDAGSTCTTVTYPATDSANGLLSYPTETAVVGTDCEHLTDATYPADAISDTRISYDGQTFGASPTQGRPTATQIVKGYGNSTAASAQWMTPTITSYDDSLGRPTKVIDPLGRKVTTSYTQAPGGSTASVATTNPMNWTTTTTLDPARGEPLAITDQNNHSTSAAYDSFGRTTGVWRPDHPQADFPNNPSASYSYIVSTTNPSVVQTTTPTSISTQTSYALYDGLGRQRQTQQQVGDKKLKVTDTGYDDAGRVSVVYGPYAATGDLSTSMVARGSATPLDHTTYDGAGRKTIESLSYGSTESYRTTYSYAGVDRTDVTPPSGGIASRTLTNSRGKPASLIQYLSAVPGQGTAEKTTYGYDARGDLTSMADPAGNQWQWTFDVLGRVITSTDPDTGLTTNAYDDAGRTISTTDARNTTVAYRYDNADRRTGAYLSSTSGPILSTWQYDTLEKGQLTSATSYVGSTATTPGVPYTKAVTGYDTGDRPTGTSVTIPSNTAWPALAGTYTSGTTYTASGLVDQQSDPAEGGLPAEDLTVGWDSFDNQAGLSSDAANYLAGVTLDGLGRPIQLSSGKNLQIVNTLNYYPDTGRKSSSVMQAVVRRNAQVSADTYTYDDAGDITAIKSVQDTGGFNDSTTTQVTDAQCFGYDQLQNLTNAWTPASNDCSTAPTTQARVTLGGPSPYWTSYTVAPTTGNRRTAVQHATTANGQDTTDTYTYSGAGTSQPHAYTTVTHQTGTQTSTDSPTYNKIGATTSRKNGKQSFSWNAQGKLATATVAGTTQINTYDADGNLLLQSDSQTGTTLFLGDTELHVAAGSSSVTGARTYSVAGLGVIAERVSDANSHGADDGSDTTLFWLHTDPAGTVDASVNDTARLVTRRYEDPYGNQRPSSPSSLPWHDTYDFLNAPTNSLDNVVHLGARDYDPKAGKFLSVDPVLSPQQPNQNNGYSYGHNNPLSHPDPSGAAPRCVLEGTCASHPSPQGGAPVPNGGNRIDPSDFIPVSGSGRDAPSSAATPSPSPEAAPQPGVNYDGPGPLQSFLKVLNAINPANNFKSCYTQGDLKSCVESYIQIEIAAGAIACTVLTEGVCAEGAYAAGAVGSGLGAALAADGVEEGSVVSITEVVANAEAAAADTAAGGGGDLTTLYRAVSKDELKDIEGTGQYRPAPSGMSGKYFFPTRGQAENFQSLLEKSGQGSTCITSGCIPTSMLRGVDVIQPAGEGPAYFVPNELLPYFSNIVTHGG